MSSEKISDQVERLNGDNYNEWIVRLESALEGHSLVCANLPILEDYIDPDCHNHVLYETLLLRSVSEHKRRTSGLCLSEVLIAQIISGQASQHPWHWRPGTTVNTSAIYIDL